MHETISLDFPDDDDDDLGGELIEAKNSRELNEFIYFFIDRNFHGSVVYAKTVLNYKKRKK